MRVLFSRRLPADLITRLKTHVAEHNAAATPFYRRGLTVTDAVETALREYLDRATTKKSDTVPVAPRSTPRGAGRYRPPENKGRHGHRRGRQ